MGPFTAAPHHDVLVLVLQIAVLLFAARALGELVQRLGQPAVVGEILAGIALGPSCLSGALPWVNQWLLPQTKVQGYLLEEISLIGAMFLLLITGLEIDLPLIRRHARTAIGTAAGGIVLPFASGYLLGQWLPDALLARADQRLVFALFMATAMSISAIPVIAKVLIDLNLMRRDIGQTIIAAGMTDDTVGWILLSIVTGLASGEAIGTSAIGQAVGRVAAFMLVSFTFGRWSVKRALDIAQDEVMSPYRLLTLVVFFTFLWGAFAQALQLEAMLGAFVMGIVFGQMPRLPETVPDSLRGIALGIFAPIFFAVAGLKVNVIHLLAPDLLGMTALVILVACAGKVLGTYAGARLIGRRDHWTALAFGAGLNARGAMEIIIATIGLRLGILTQDTFSMIVLMAMTTSLMAPSALRWALQHIQPEAEELKRLRQEELAQDSLIARIHRVLLPVRLRETDGSGVRTIAAFVLQRLGTTRDLSITLLNVVEPGAKAKGTQFLERLNGLFPGKEVVKKVVEAPRAADAILDEAQKDYDLLVLGASEGKNSSRVLFTPLVDHLVRVAPCTTMVVHGAPFFDGWAPSRILVPTNGTLTARRAGELAFALAASGTEEVVVLNVVVQDRTSYRRAMKEGAVERQLGSSYQIVEKLCALGESVGARTKAEVRVGAALEKVILETVERHRIELIILATDLRPGSDRLFLGPNVERVLTNAPCPVIVVNPS
jgi:Kef-type K+ transport system membrane component KefB/nucleotide-binding universal stress UspA family protein